MPGFPHAFCSRAGPLHRYPTFQAGGAYIPAERAVALLAGEGASNPEIARGMSVSVNTVRTHLRNVFDKRGVHRRAKLAGIREVLESA